MYVCLYRVISGHYRVCLCECLLGICSQHSEFLPSLLPQILSLLDTSTELQNEHARQTALSLLTLLFQVGYMYVTFGFSQDEIRYNVINLRNQDDFVSSIQYQLITIHLSCL